MNKRCTNSSCRKTFSTLTYGGKCPFCGKEYPQIGLVTADVELTDFGPRKITVIKLVREITGLGLKESKELVESAPVVICAHIPRKEAETLKEQLEESGARVTLKRSVPPMQRRTLGKWVNVELTDLGPHKILVIKLVRKITGLGLKESRELVESAPVVISEGIHIIEAKALKMKFEETGARITLIRGKRIRK